MFYIVLAFGQSPKNSIRNIGINYFGELGFRPGVEIDLGFSVWEKEKEKQRIIRNQLSFRPSLAFYHYSHYSNNVLLSMKLNYQVRFINKKTRKYLFIEPFLRIGYLRYFLAGDVFETQNSGFKEVRFRGSNSVIFGGAFDMGGYISKRFDWIFGFDYFAESTEDKLMLHRFAAKLGTRIKLNAK